MSDILQDLRDADRRGISPPQNWTTRAADEIEKLRNTRPDSKPYKYKTVDLAWDNNERTPNDCDFEGFTAGFNAARELKEG